MSGHLVLEVLEQARRTPETVALRSWGGVAPRWRGSRDLSYRELAARIESTARNIRANGLEPGDRVLFSIRPRPEGVVLALGVVLAGGSVVFVDPGSTPELFAARLRAARPRFAATEALLYALASGPLRRIARSRGLLLPDLARLEVEHLFSGPWLPGTPLAARRAARLARETARRLGSTAPRGPGSSPAPRGPGSSPAADDRWPTDPEAEALVVFTSGTTEAPRAVVHTVGSLAGASRLLAGVHELEPGSVVHTEQMLLGLPALLAGATWSIPSRAPGRDLERFVREGRWGTGHPERASSSFLVPADVSALLEARRAARVPEIEGTVLVGGAPVTRSLLARATEALPRVRWTAVYGATEMLPIAAVGAEEKLAHPGDGDLVGAPLPGVEVRVAEDGELCVSGPSLMRGYLGAEPVTEHRTGDLARLDEQGRIVLLGRSRDMIIRGTVNIYPALFEPRIAALPGVREAVLVGLPQEDGDERVALALTADSEATTAPSSAVELVADSRLVREVRAALPEVLDHGALPDLVVEVRAIPVSGRSRKPDRRALAASLAELG